MQRQNEAGFSAVELLITLFIAASFLAVGYQLYGVIVKDSGEARSQAQASNIAYQQLRKASASVRNPCVASTTTTPVTDPNLSNVSMKTVVTCLPPSHSPGLSRVTVTIGYGTPKQEVTHAIFASK